MRKPRDGQSTKELVLATARQVFAEHGFEGTSLAMISDKCGISDGLILHHFQNKKNLYQAVLEILSQEYTNNLVQAKESSANPQEMIQKTIAATFNYWKNDTTYQRISMWSYLEGHSGLGENEAKFTAGLFQEVKKLQEQGFMDNRFSPIFLLTTVIGSIHFWLRYRDQYRSVLNLSDAPDEMDQLFLDQLVQLIMEMARKEKT